MTGVTIPPGISFDHTTMTTTHARSLLVQYIALKLVMITKSMEDLGVEGNAYYEYTARDDVEHGNCSLQLPMALLIAAAMRCATKLDNSYK